MKLAASLLDIRGEISQLTDLTTCHLSLSSPLCVLGPVYPQGEPPADPTRRRSKRNEGRGPKKGVGTCGGIQPVPAGMHDKLDGAVRLGLVTLVSGPHNIKVMHLVKTSVV